MDVTVAVIPRERFRPLEQSLRSLFETISADVPVIVVDGGAPKHVLDAVKKLQAKRPFELIETGTFVLPNKARNIALGRAKTKFVAFCDNDLEYSPNWLDYMLEAASAEKVGAVAPTTLIGPTTPTLIHHAGGTFTRRKDANGGHFLHSNHALANTPIKDLVANDYHEAPTEITNFEYHCVMVNAKAMREVGGHDERMINFEHLDSSLRLQAHGYKIAYAPKAHVLYRAFDSFKAEDLPYFHFRWALHRDMASHQIYAKNWGLSAPNQTPEKCFSTRHTNRAVRGWIFKYPKWLPQRSRLARIIHATKLKVWNSYDGKLPAQEAPHIPPPPPENGLDLAGIPLTRSTVAKASSAA